MPLLDSKLKSIVNQTLAPMGVSQIRFFAQKFAQIPGIIKLTLGEPDFNVPEHVKAAAIQSIRENKSHYSDQRGIMELRTAISDYLQQRFHVSYDAASEIVVTVGATEAIFAALGSLINPGDKILVATPTFALYWPVIEIFGGIPVQVDTTADGFRLTGKHLQEVLDREGAGNVKALVLNFPGNPTGFEYSRDQLQELADVIKQNAMYVLTDEIYAELTYGQPHTSMAELLPEQTILINGLSKSHAMTGYRIGYFVGPKDFVVNASKLHGFAVTSPSNPAQYAALEALTNGVDDAQDMRQVYQQRRDYIVPKLNALGYETALPAGAFYAFAKIPASFGLSSVEFATRLAEEAKVGVTPGSAFGAGGEGYVRLSYASSMADLQEAMARLTVFTEKMQLKIKG
ncbi:aminotransferase class I/II-fold pyridoxal phosphate-dependent enzyme [Levilactobacillus wangkuiensis]|uniref:aminotransferase class I/II-fold pyridoxal phosphate-dependent enzyme n=1 Tax=Levilactobacillus wangkuiensis TaxID=2799566 RepID=UPI00194568BC|nr:aminotransferase class I/II-fold pyridoxal phosphate-dependent enzyme [Levilactobacillus wangkuiensis]